MVKNISNLFTCSTPAKIMFPDVFMLINCFVLFWDKKVQVIVVRKVVSYLREEVSKFLCGVKNSVSEQFTWDLWLKKWH